MALIESLQIDSTHLVAALGWLTMVIGSMGAFIAMMVKRNLDSQDADRQALIKTVDSLRDSLTALKEKDGKIEDLINRIDQQHEDILRTLEASMVKVRSSK